MRDVEHFTTAIANAVVVLGTIGTWLAGMLPPLAALAAILWTGWQWWHHPATVTWRQRRADKRGAERGKT